MDRLSDFLKEKPICIYGCGECGIQLYLLLKEAGIEVGSFGDRDSTKAGYVMDGVFCRTYGEILDAEKRDILLIIAIANGKKIVSEFQNLGFENVFYHEDVKRELRIKLRDNSGDSRVMSIDALKELQQGMEEIFLNRDCPKGKQRDSMLGLIWGKSGVEGDEAFTS